MCVLNVSGGVRDQCACVCALDVLVCERAVYVCVCVLAYVLNVLV